MVCRDRLGKTVAERLRLGLRLSRGFTTIVLKKKHFKSIIDLNNLLTKHSNRCQILITVRRFSIWGASFFLALIGVIDFYMIVTTRNRSRVIKVGILHIGFTCFPPSSQSCASHLHVEITLIFCPRQLWLNWDTLWFPSLLNVIIL